VVKSPSRKTPLYLPFIQDFTCECQTSPVLVPVPVFERIT
jgi:hypothetical protein